MATWFRPVDHSGTDSDWHDGEYAYDSNPLTKAYADIQFGPPFYINWSGWLQLNSEEVAACTAVKLLLDADDNFPGSEPLVQVDVYEEGAWVNVFYAARGNGWLQIGFPEKLLTATRIRFGAQPPPIYWVKGGVSDSAFYGEYYVEQEAVVYFFLA